ncbi:MAG: replicative DNA helicase [Planctomycetaceae bacterium]|nr:replicative DNA helicase [Planctomycetaceae bacterium]
MSEHSPRKYRSKKQTPTVDITSLQNAPPQNLDAEKGVLGALLRDPQICDDVIPLVSADDFYADAHQRIYRHIIGMRNDNSSIDLTLLVSRLKSADELEAVGGFEYLGALLGAAPITTHTEHYAKIVKEKSVLRQLIHTGSTIVGNAYAPEATAKDLLEKSSQQIFELAAAQTTNHITPIRDVMGECGSYLDLRLQGEFKGIKTGFTDLNKLLDGFHPNELIILAARPGKGKTAFAMNIVENVALEQKKTVLFVSLEMSKLELGMRLICSRGRIDNNKIKNQYLSKEERHKYSDVTNEFATAGTIFIDDTPNRSVNEIAAAARKLKRQNDSDSGLGLLVIDYIGLITPENSADPRQEQVAKIARRLKGLAREIEIPVLCLAQLNRSAEEGGRGDPKPKLSHLRESGAIEQDADVVLFIHRPDERKSKDEEENGAEEQNKAEMIVAKQRNGATGTVNLFWYGEYTRFVSKEDNIDEEYNDLSQSSHNDFAPFGQEPVQEYSTDEF